jgi:hypothetical protein
MKKERHETMGLAWSRWQEVVPEDEAVLNSVDVVAQSHFILSYLRDVVDELDIVTFAGRNRFKVPLPGKGGCHYVEPRSSRPAAPDDLTLLPGALSGVCSLKEHDYFFFQYSSFSDSGTVYQATITKAAAGRITVDSKIIFRAEVPGLNPDNFVTRQVATPRMPGPYGLGT